MTAKPYTALRRCDGRRCATERCDGESHERLLHMGYGDRDIARFNAEVPVGTAVRYWPILRWPLSEDRTDVLRTKTRSAAWALGHGDGVVMIEGKAGGVALSHVEVLP